MTPRSSHSVATTPHTRKYRADIVAVEQRRATQKAVKGDPVGRCQDLHLQEPMLYSHSRVTS